MYIYIYMYMYMYINMHIYVYICIYIYRFYNLIWICIGSQGVDAPLKTSRFVSSQFCFMHCEGETHDNAYIYTYLYEIVCKHIHIYVYIYMYVYICNYIYSCMYIYLYANWKHYWKQAIWGDRKNIHMKIISIFIHTYTYMCMYIYIYVDMCMYIYIWIYVERTIKNRPSGVIAKWRGVSPPTFWNPVRNDSFTSGTRLIYKWLIHIRDMTHSCRTH